MRQVGRVGGRGLRASVPVWPERTTGAPARRARPRPGGHGRDGGWRSLRARACVPAVSREQPVKALIGRVGRRGRVPSDHDAFDLVERDRVRRPVVQLRRPRRRVAGNLLRVLERTPVRQIRRDARRPDVWQHVDAGRPAAAARRLIIASTTRRVSDRPLRRPDRSTL